jgi:hypothetical protein
MRYAKQSHEGSLGFYGTAASFNPSNVNSVTFYAIQF